MCGLCSIFATHVNTKRRQLSDKPAAEHGSVTTSRATWEPRAERLDALFTQRPVVNALDLGSETIDALMGRAIHMRSRRADRHNSVRLLRSTGCAIARRSTVHAVDIECVQVEIGGDKPELIVLTTRRRQHVQPSRCWTVLLRGTTHLFLHAGLECDRWLQQWLLIWTIHHVGQAMLLQVVAVELFKNSQPHLHASVMIAGWRCRGLGFAIHPLLGDTPTRAGVVDGGMAAAIPHATSREPTTNHTQHAPQKRTS